MSLLQSYIDPATTDQILINLNSAIDEAQLMSTLDDMSTRIQKIESVKGSSENSDKLRQEIKILEIQINYIRDRASFS